MKDVIDPVEVMARGIREVMGPVVGNPEYLAKPGNVERLQARQQSAAKSFARAALTAASEAGWVLVPREPTEAMERAGVCELDPHFPDECLTAASACYAAMIAASQPEGKAE